MFLKLSRCFDFSTRSLGHVMFSFAGTAQETGTGGRSGGSWYPCSRFIDGAFFFMYIGSFTFSNIILYIYIACIICIY